MTEPIDSLLGIIAEIERLLELPGAHGNIEKVMNLADQITMRAPSGGIADLARKLKGKISDLGSRNRYGIITMGRVHDAVWRLKSALEHAKRLTR